MSPRIMKVAVPLPKHSAMLGQDASSHTVCSFCSRRMSLISWKREFGLAARTRIQAGFGRRSRGTILIGTRSVLALPFSFTPASRMVESRGEILHQRGFDRMSILLHSDVFGLRHAQSRIAAGVDGAERRQVHVHVEREPMVAAAADDADAERGDLGAVDIHARRAGLA